MEEMAVSVRTAVSRTSRPGRSTKQKATLQPIRPNSRATARPSPVAPPVTIATLPRNPSGTMALGSGCSSTAPAPDGRGARCHEGGSKPVDDMERAKVRGAGAWSNPGARRTFTPCIASSGFS